MRDFFLYKYIYLRPWDISGVVHLGHKRVSTNKGRTKASLGFLKREKQEIVQVLIQLKMQFKVYFIGHVRSEIVSTHVG